MAGPGIEPGISESLVKCSELSYPGQSPQTI